MTTVEDIERKQRMRRLVFRLVMWMLLVLLCIAVGWLASRPGHHELQDDPESGIPNSGVPGLGVPVLRVPASGACLHGHVFPA
jgi:hypothetical protein